MPALYNSLGVEEIVDDLEIAIFEQLADAYQVVSERLDQRDRDRDARHGRDFIAVEFEPIPIGNFHQGSVPSFVMTSDEKDLYPLVAIVPDRVAPDAESASMDHYDILSNVITVHAFARSSPDMGDRMFDVCYRRAVRYGAAINRIVKTDSGLRRKLRGPTQFTQLRISEPWLFPPNKDGTGDDWCWQTAGSDFSIKNNSITP